MISNNPPERRKRRNRDHHGNRPVGSSPLAIQHQIGVTSMATKPCRPTPVPAICGAIKRGECASLKELVADFLMRYIGCIQDEEQMFRRMPSLDLAIHHVAMATDENDKCFDHQRRITQRARRSAKKMLIEGRGRLKSCKTFDQLHALFEELLGPIEGIGTLYIYDAALRMGAYLRLSPKRVYLHAGTRDGAKALGLDHGRKYLDRAELPQELRTLGADQVESFLCIYKDRLSPGIAG